MSEDKGNDEEKTEEPTHHRLEEAFKKGNVAFSKEILHWVMMGAAALILVALSPYVGNRLKNAFSPFIHQPDLFQVDQDFMGNLALQIVLDFFLILLPILGIFLITGIGAGLLQTRLAISYSALIPKLERLSPLAGFKRIYSKKSMVEFIKGLLKIALIGIALYLFLWAKIEDIPQLIYLSPLEALKSLSDYVLTTMIIIVGSLTFIAGLDYLYQKYTHLKSLRMTKDEVKREHKTQEGDPLMKHRRRQVAYQRVRRNLKESIGRATAIITNPTHYAVALEYNQESMDAPIVVAKGIDFMALTIRELGKELKVPIIENPPLAKALYSSVDLDQAIPPEHYKAVAEVIRFVMNLKQQQWL